YTANNHQVDMAQARFLRAFAYFYISRIWGDVPLITRSSEHSFTNKGREDKDKVLAWVKQELLAAAEDLPFMYSANDPQQQGNYYNELGSRWNGALVTKISAYAVLAHLSAWSGNYPDASAYTAFVDLNYAKSNINYATTSNLTNASGFFYDKHSSQMFAFPAVWAHAEAAFTGHIEALTRGAPVANKNIHDVSVTEDRRLQISHEPKRERCDIHAVGNPSSDLYLAKIAGRYPIVNKTKGIQGGLPGPSFRIF